MAFQAVERINALYAQFNEFEYEPPTDEELQALRFIRDDLIHVMVRKPEMSPVDQVSLNLKKAATSYCHGVLLALQIYLTNDEVIERCMQSAWPALQAMFNEIDQARDQFSNPAELKEFIDTIFNAYLMTLADVIRLGNLELQPEAAYKVLEHAEVLANWERRKANSFAIATVLKVESGGKQVLLDIPKNGTLTDAQQSEFRHLDSHKPAWFTALHPFQQQYVLRHRDEIADGKYPAFPATQAIMPGMRNAYEHRYIQTDAEGKLRVNIPIHLHSSIAPFHVEDDKERLRVAKLDAHQVLAQANPEIAFDNFWGAKVSQELKKNRTTKPLFYHLQLLSPMGKLDTVWSALYFWRTGKRFSDNNELMRAENRMGLVSAAKQDGIAYQSSCWGINVDGQFRDTSFSSKENQYARQRMEVVLRETLRSLAEQSQFGSFVSNEVLTLLRDNNLDGAITYILGTKDLWTSHLLNGNQAKLNQFVLALHAYIRHEALWNDTDRSSDQNNHLEVAACEMLFWQGLGHTVQINCKSTKDRARTQLLQMAAMVAASFHNLDEGLKTPRQDSELAELERMHKCGHQQAMAEQNSFGRYGLLSGNGGLVSHLGFDVAKGGRHLGGEVKPMLGARAHRNLSARIQLQERMGKLNKYSVRDPNKKGMLKTVLSMLEYVYYTARRMQNPETKRKARFNHARAQFVSAFDQQGPYKQTAEIEFKKPETKAATHWIKPEPKIEAEPPREELSDAPRDVIGAMLRPKYASSSNGTGGINADVYRMPVTLRAQ